MGISALSEWDVLVFVYRHGPTLISASRIAQLIGYESDVVTYALDLLKSEQLIEYSRSSQGVRLYRIVNMSSDDERHRCFRHLIKTAESRAGRLLLARSLQFNEPKVVTNVDFIDRGSN
jgi:DNA-binding MarR family transcriptional regulator